MSTITFVTTCWEYDWEILLTTNKLNTMIERCNYSFDKKILLINNVKDIDAVSYYAQVKVDEKIIDAFYISDYYSNEALAHFAIDKASFNGGYYYSIANLVSIYLCDTDYLVYFTGDTVMSANHGNWIGDSIKILEVNRNVKVANPCWNFDYDMAKKESFTELGKFYVSCAFQTNVI